MKKLFRFTAEIITDAFNSGVYFLKCNLLNLANVLSLLVPFIMYFVGQQLALDRGRVTVGVEIAIPIVACIIVYYLKSLANKCRKGNNIPVPEKRFTEIDEEMDEVRVRNDRIQEVILYLADLEDWFEKKGLL